MSKDSLASLNPWTRKKRKKSSKDVKRHCMAKCKNGRRNFFRNVVRRLQRWMLIHKNPGQHSTFGSESLGGNYGLRQDELRPRLRSACLQNFRRQGAKAKVHRVCVQLAMKGRRYTHVAASSPSLEEARSWLESPAVEGGMSANILPDSESEVRKVLACFDPSSPADLNKEATARKDFLDTLSTLKKRTKKKVTPRVECTSRVVHHGFGSTVLCCGGLDSTWTWL